MPVIAMANVENHLEPERKTYKNHHQPIRISNQNQLNEILPENSLFLTELNSTKSTGNSFTLSNSSSSSNSEASILFSISQAQVKSTQLKKENFSPTVHGHQNKSFVNHLTHEQFLHALQLIVSFGDPRLQYINQVKIGEGSSSVIYLANDLKSSNQNDNLVVIKKINFHKHKRIELLFNEVVIMKSNYHSNIVKMYASYLVDDELWIVMEYLSGGSLTDIVLKSRMNEVQIATVCKSVLTSLAFLHKEGIIHRDIKSDSILLTKDGKVKLTDFGFVTQANSDSKKKSLGNISFNNYFFL
jgi:p21-activated kinase 7